MLDGFAVDEMCDSGRGQVLAPWPNRLGDGRYSYEGRDAQAALDEPARHNAIHGLVRWLPWHLVSRAQNVLCLGCTLHPQPGYPVATRARHRVPPGPRRAERRHPASPTSTPPPAPFGIGFHPYLTLSTPIDSTSLAIPARRRLVTDERGLPTSTVSVAGSELDFTAPPVDRRHRPRHRLHRPAPRRRLAWHGSSSTTRPGDGASRCGWTSTSATSWCSPATPSSPSAGAAASIAVEPMSCPPDALATGVDLVRLEPGASWAGRWGITPAEAQPAPAPGAGAPEPAARGTKRWASSSGRAGLPNR